MTRWNNPSCFVSWRGCFVGVLLILLIVLSILRLGCVRFFGFFVDGAVINAPGSFDVNMVIGLPCDESEARLMTSIVLLLWNWMVSSWSLDECDSCLCRCFAFACLLCARAASLDFSRNRLFSFVFVLSVGSFSFVVVCACLVPAFPVGRMVLVSLVGVFGCCCLSFRVFPVGMSVL